MPAGNIPVRQFLRVQRRPEPSGGRVGNNGHEPGFWMYTLHMGPTDGAQLRQILLAWHAAHYPQCRPLRGKTTCEHLRLITEGLKLAKVHRALLAQIVVGIDAEYLVRKEY